VPQQTLVEIVGKFYQVLNKIRFTFIKLNIRFLTLVHFLTCFIHISINAIDVSKKSHKSIDDNYIGDGLHILFSFINEGNIY
jgi:hypothetical protein